MAIKWPAKDPDERLDYTIDWTDWFGAIDGAGDSISTSEWTVPSGLTKHTDDIDGLKTTVWLSGGTANESYSVLNHIVTAAGRIAERTVILPVKSK